MCCSEFWKGSCEKSFFATNSIDKANICKYFLAQSTHVIMHFVTLLSRFDERRFFMTLIMDVLFSQTCPMPVLCC